MARDKRIGVDGIYQRAKLFPLSGAMLFELCRCPIAINDPCDSICDPA